MDRTLRPEEAILLERAHRHPLGMMLTHRASEARLASKMVIDGLIVPYRDTPSQFEITTHGVTELTKYKVRLKVIDPANP